MPDDIKDKALYSKNYLVAKGLSPIAASGIVGNLKEESNFSTTVKGRADDKGSEGIAQWHSERKQGLYNFANKQNRDYKNLDTQLDYIIYELKQPQYKKAYEGISKATTPEEATVAFMNHYEKPAEWAKKQSQGRRVASANSVFGNSAETSNTEYTTETSKNFFPEYTELAPEQKRLLKTYVDQGLSLTEHINTPQSKSDIAKQTIIQSQNEEDFLAELGSLEQTQQPIQQEEPQDNLYQLPELNLPEYEKPELPIAQDGGSIQEDNKWLKNWYENRVIPNKFLQQNYNTDREDYLNKLKTIPAPTYPDFIATNKGNVDGAYSSNNKTIKIAKGAPKYTYTHEANHYLTDFNGATQMANEDAVKENFGTKKDLPEYIKENYNYYSQPTEVHSRIQALRKEAGIKPDQEVTPEFFETFLKAYKGDNGNINDLLDSTKKENIIELLNLMVSNEKVEQTRSRLS